MKLGDELRGDLTWIVNGLIVVLEGTDKLSRSDDLRGGKPSRSDCTNNSFSIKKCPDLHFNVLNLSTPPE